MIWWTVSYTHKKTDDRKKWQRIGKKCITKIYSAIKIIEE